MSAISGGVVALVVVGLVIVLVLYRRRLKRFTISTPFGSGALETGPGDIVDSTGSTVVDRSDLGNSPIKTTPEARIRVRKSKLRDSAITVRRKK